MYLSEDGIIVAYFTISLNVLNTNGISKSIVKKLDGIDKNRADISCFLIAQLGKSDKCNFQIGNYLLNDSIETIKEASNIIGGRFIILDSVNVDKVLKFYENNDFVAIDKNRKGLENIKMYYPFIIR